MENCFSFFSPLTPSDFFFLCLGSYHCTMFSVMQINLIIFSKAFHIYQPLFTSMAPEKHIILIWQRSFQRTWFSDGKMAKSQHFLLKTTTILTGAGEKITFITCNINLSWNWQVWVRFYPWNISYTHMQNFTYYFFVSCIRSFVN